VTRTGAAVVVVLSGCGAAPRLVARREVALVPAGMPAQPYHAAVGLEMAEAEKLVSRAERGVQEAAIAGLRAVADGLPAGSVVFGVAVVVKAVSLPVQLAGVLRSHAWMHAAEGVLYREAVLAAARDRGYLARAVEASVLPAAVDAWKHSAAPLAALAQNRERRHHHLRAGRRPPMPIGPVPGIERAQVQGGHRVQHHEHQIVLRQPLAHVHRQQQRLITLREKEILRHTPGSQAPRPVLRRHAVYATG
jgi:hypothetical protein